MAGADAAGLHRRLRAEHALVRPAHDRHSGARSARSTSRSDRTASSTPRCTSGNLLRMEPDGGKQEVFANTGGRVLGFDFDAQGRMIAADAMKGLLAITADRRVTVLADRVSPNDPIRYANSVVVAPDGTIYFTDASTRFSPARMGRHLRGERARHHGAIRDRPCARL